MNRIQRRLWKVVVATSPAANTADLVERLERLVDAQVQDMTPALRRVMETVLASQTEIDYARLGREIVKTEGVWITEAAVRKRVSRAMQMLERAVRQAWREGVGRVDV